MNLPVESRRRDYQLTASTLPTDPRQHEMYGNEEAMANRVDHDSQL